MASQRSAGASTLLREPRPVLRLALGSLVLAGLAAALWRPFAPSPAGVAEAGRWFDAAHLAQVEAYREPRYLAGLAVLALRLAVPLAVALTPPGRRLVASLGARLGWHRPALAAGGIVLAVVVATDLLVLPWQFWASYVHDGAFGLRTQGPWGWWRDWLVTALPPWLLAAGLAAAGFALAARLPRLWPEVGALAAAGAVVAVVTLSPLLLEPLTLRTAPLEDGPLREEVTRVAAAAGRPDAEIVVADASRRTTRQNAYVSGLGATRRIVLYDTLVDAQPPSVVTQVVAHELAHDRHRDLARGALAGGAAVALAVLGLGWLVRRRVRRGRQERDADPRSAALLLAVVVVAVNLAAPLERALSREVEAAADLGGLELTADPAGYRAQREAVARANLSDPDPPTWVRLLWSTHPPVVERLELGQRWPVAWSGPMPSPLEGSGRARPGVGEDTAQVGEEALGDR
ncbi:MAG: M48 family metalloprotease [Actinomycetota bacterium]